VLSYIFFPSLFSHSDLFPASSASLDDASPTNFSFRLQFYSSAFHLPPPCLFHIASLPSSGFVQAWRCTPSLPVLIASSPTFSSNSFSTVTTPFEMFVPRLRPTRTSQHTHTSFTDACGCRSTHTALRFWHPPLFAVSTGCISVA